MDVCQCERYAEAAKNFKVYTLCTLLPEVARIAPENTYVDLRTIERMDDQRRINKPYILKTGPPKPLEEIPTKWIPVLPGIVVQRYVNETRTIYTPRIFI